MFGWGNNQAAVESEITWGRANAKEIDINSKIAGRVVELLVQEGDTVSAGEILAQIDERAAAHS
ncbi:MAG: biotin/lipoyl-binding protein [Selenomonadaceae bacterium]|nr:biotin/lipoyl-binding protein [Selenomonadaceae bacterium]